MFVIFTYIWDKSMVNVGKYTITCIPRGGQVAHPLCMVEHQWSSLNPTFENPHKNFRKKAHLSMRPWHKLGRVQISKAVALEEGLNQLLRAVQSVAPEPTILKKG